MARQTPSAILGGLLPILLLLGACGQTNRHDHFVDQQQTAVNAQQQPSPNGNAASTRASSANAESMPFAVGTGPITSGADIVPWSPVSVSEPFRDRPTAAIRSWAAKAGGFQTTAKLIGISEGQVQLEKVAGGIANVPVDKLSNDDRRYVKEFVRLDPLANVYIGKVSHVMDDRTLSVADEDGSHLVHLEGVEAIANDDKRAADAKEALSRMVLDKWVWVEWREEGKYDFALGQVYVDGRHVNADMIAEGYAKYDRQPRANPRLANAELIARRKRLGVWKDDYAEAPFGFNR